MYLCKILIENKMFVVYVCGLGVDGISVFQYFSISNYFNIEWYDIVIFVYSLHPCY